MTYFSPQKVREHMDMIEARAKAAGISMTRVFDAAGITQTTWWRWRNTPISPRVGNLHAVEKAMDALEKAAA